MEALEHRVIKLELRVEDHAEELRSLKGISNDLRNSLSGIEKTLAQIKWISTGAVIVFVAQSMGIDKLVLKILAV